MTRSDGLTFRQLMALTFVCLLSPAIRLLPRAAAGSAGAGAWLAPLIAAVPAAGLTALLRALMKNRREGESLARILLRALGRGPGKAVCLLLGLWLVFYTGIILRTGAERLLSTVYVGGSPGFFMAVTALAALAVSFGRVRSLGRMGEVSALALGIVLALVLALSAPDIRPENLLPAPGPASGFLAAALPVLSVTAKGFLFPLLPGGVMRERRELAVSLRWTGLLLLVMLGITAATVGALSADVAAGLQHPFFIMIRNISVFGVIERIEAVVITLWVITDFLFVAVLLRIFDELFAAVAERESPWPLHPILAGCSVACGLLAARDAFTLERLSQGVVPAVNLLLALILSTVALIVGKLRRTV